MSIRYKKPYNIFRYGKFGSVTLFLNTVHLLNFDFSIDHVAVVDETEFSVDLDKSSFFFLSDANLNMQLYSDAERESSSLFKYYIK